MAGGSGSRRATGAVVALLVAIVVVVVAVLAAAIDIGAVLPISSPLTQDVVTVWVTLGLLMAAATLIAVTQLAGDDSPTGPPEPGWRSAGQRLRWWLGLALALGALATIGVITTLALSP